MFLSVDPLVAISKDPYLYASGNPIGLSDPSGLCDGSCFISLPHGAVPVGGCSADPGVCERYNTNEGRATLRSLWQQEIDYRNSQWSKGAQFANYGPSYGGSYFMFGASGSHIAADQAIGVNPNTGTTDYHVDTDSFGYNAFMMVYFALLTPPIGAAPGGTGGAATGSTARVGAVAVDDVLSGLASGRSAGVRVVGSADELDDLFTGLSRGGSQIESRYPGKLVELPDGTTIGLRGASRSGGPTIDIRLPNGETVKVHIDPWPPAG